MPSLRVLCVVLLIGLGASAAGLAGGSQPDPVSQRRAAIASAGPQQRATVQRAGRSSPASIDVREENALPGTTGWRITRTNGTAPGLSAYTGDVSVNTGDQVPLHVNGSGPVQIRAFRIGWYGGIGAREVWRGKLDASSQADDPARWPAQALADTRNWPPGHYLLRLDLRSASRYVPLTVRSAQAIGQVLLVSSPLTWQAENGATTARAAAAAGSQARSFDRPYAQNYGAGGFLTTDAPVIQLAERDGHSLAYTTDLDLARRPGSLDGATAIVFGSSSQYWTPGLRAAVIDAIHSGTNAAFFGAGTGTRRVQLSGDGRSITIQPSAPSATTALTGLRPVCSRSSLVSLSDGSPWVVADPGWWGYGDVAVRAGEALPGLVSGAPDGMAAPGAEPAAVLARSPVTCPGGTAAGPHLGAYWADPSGAGVFTTGTSRWACAAGGFCPGRASARVPASTRTVAAGVTRAVLKAFAQARAGHEYPAG